MCFSPTKITRARQSFSILAAGLIYGTLAAPMAGIVLAQPQPEKSSKQVIKKRDQKKGVKPPSRNISKQLAEFSDRTPYRKPSQTLLR